MATKKEHILSLIPGDGIGPEVTSAARKVLAAAGCIVDWQIKELRIHWQPLHLLF